MAWPRLVYRPKSILRLILIGFALVGVPLMIALVNAALSVDRLANRSQQAVFQAVQATENSRALVEAITAMERNARQYQVLGDQTLLEVYQDNHDIFESTVGMLRGLPLSDSQRELLAQLEGDELDIHGRLAALAHDAPEVEQAVKGFGELAVLAQRFLAQNSRVIDREVRRMQESARETQRTLMLQAMALVPVALVLMAVFAMVIARPVRQLDQVIRRLGSENPGEPAVITGPRDLELLGERLNWLRGRLQEVEAEKTKFLRHISHELKTPLTAIREGAGLLGDEVVGSLNGQQREIAEILQENVVQLQRLIEDLLNFNMATARSGLLLRREVNLQGLVEAVAADHKMAMLAQHKELKLETQPITVMGDPEKLRVVVDNLLSNAIKFTPEGGAVWVKLYPCADRVCVEVADSGPGIPPADRGRVFEAFYQGRHATGSHIRGTGLGLSIAKEYAQAHGGKIEVVSDDSPGARIRVSLPADVEGVK